VCLGNHQDVVYGFRRGHHPTFCNGFHRWLFMVSVMAENVCSWFPPLVVELFPSWQ